MSKFSLVSCFGMSLAALFCISGCAAKLASGEQRKVVYIEEVKASRSTSYNRMLSHLSKNLGDSNQSIKMNDADSGQIVAKINVPCNKFRQFGDPNPYSLSFNLDFQSKDNRVRLSFEDLEMIDQYGKPVQWAYNQITDKKQVQESKACLDPLKNELLQAINGSAVGDW